MEHIDIFSLIWRLECTLYSDNVAFWDAVIEGEPHMKLAYAFTLLRDQLSDRLTTRLGDKMIDNNSRANNLT